MDAAQAEAKHVLARQGRGLWTTVLLVVAIAVIVVALIDYTQRASARSRLARAWELHTMAVMLDTQRLLSSIQDVESGQRGYLLTGNPVLLAPYHRGVAETAVRFEALRQLTADSAVQQRNLATLKRLIDRKLVIAAKRVVAAERGGPAAGLAILPLGQGEQAMNDIRQQFEAIQSNETRLLTERSSQSETAAENARRAVQLVIGFGVLVLAGAVTAAIAAARAASRARALARAKLIADSVREQLELRVAERTQALEAANDTVRQMQKMEAIGQLTGGIAHDFNNMLSIVIGSLDLVLRRIERGRTDFVPLIDNAIAGAQRAATLTARLLAFSRQQTLVPTVVEPNALVASMSELLRRALGEQVRLETVLAGGLWRICADAGQIENALLNLAVNARDAMPGGGHLTIETANTALDDAYAAAHADVTAGQYVMIAVSDTGEGMPPEVIARAFDPFFTTKPVGKGTGLGLSQVFGFVKQSHGHVKVYSEVGRGTTIRLYLPRYVGEAAAAVAEAAAGDLPRALPGESILVVEDEAGVRNVSVGALRDLGYIVHHAESGDVALRLLGEGLPVSLLFTDIVMPGMTGRQLYERASQLRPGLPVLYTTGYTRNAVVHDGTLDAGPAFLAKPFTVDGLARKVRTTIDAAAGA